MRVLGIEMRGCIYVCVTGYDNIECMNANGRDVG
jgi:hypothetical protein